MNTRISISETNFSSFPGSEFSFPAGFFIGGYCRSFHTWSAYEKTGLEILESGGSGDGNRGSGHRNRGVPGVPDPISGGPGGGRPPSGGVGTPPGGVGTPPGGSGTPLRGGPGPSRGGPGPPSGGVRGGPGPGSRTSLGLSQCTTGYPRSRRPNRPNFPYLTHEKDPYTRY